MNTGRANRLSSVDEKRESSMRWSKGQEKAPDKHQGGEVEIAVLVPNLFGVFTHPLPQKACEIGHQLGPADLERSEVNRGSLISVLWPNRLGGEARFEASTTLCEGRNSEEYDAALHSF